MILIIKPMEKQRVTIKFYDSSGKVIGVYEKYWEVVKNLSLSLEIPKDGRIEIRALP